jgi:Fe-Mn family superoxide dismutase
MKHEMPRLPYAPDALAPRMSRETLDYHYGKHLQTYVDNLNKLIQGTEFERLSLEEIVRRADGPVFNNAAQTWNHTFFFDSLFPAPKRRPTGRLGEAIDRDFGSFEAMEEAFTQTALGIFGSGWAWLSADKGGKLTITPASNAGNPMTEGLTPLMTCDVWEHAYYIDYRNRRADFLAAFRELIDWSVVEKRYKS